MNTIIPVIDNTPSINAPVRREGFFDQAIAYTEQPSCEENSGAPFGDLSAHSLFSLFTASIIKENVLFTR